MPQLKLFYPGPEASTHQLTDKPLTIGRHPDNEIVIEHGSVSSFHVEISLSGDAWWLKDLGSTNGTKLNGVPVTEARIEQEDAILIGGIEAIWDENETSAPAPREVPAASVPAAVEPPPKAQKTPPLPEPGKVTQASSAASRGTQRDKPLKSSASPRATPKPVAAKKKSLFAKARMPSALMKRMKTDPVGTSILLFAVVTLTVFVGAVIRTLLLVPSY